MFTKPSKVITVDTLINLKGVSTKNPTRRVVSKEPVDVKEILVKNVSPPSNSPPIVLTKPIVQKVELSSCYKELSTNGANIVWVGDRL